MWLLDVDGFSGCFWFLRHPGLLAVTCPFPAKGAEAGQWQESPSTHPTAGGQQRGCTDMGLCQRQVDLVGQEIPLLPWCELLGGYLGFMALEKFSGFSGISVGLQPSGFVSASYSMDLSVHWSLRITLNVWSEWSIEDAKIQLVSCFIYYSLNYYY